MQKSLLALALLSACSTTHAAPTPTVPKAATIDTSGNVYELAARRAQMLGWLREYRDAGNFPVDAAGKPASVFQDANGVRCPMAELLHKSGRDDLVAAVVKVNNTVRLADVHDGPLYDWMLSSGLTPNEINLVQGAMNNDFGWMREINVEDPSTILAAKAQVRGKLETAELALRDNTSTSLAQANKRLPAERTVDGLAHEPITGTASIVPEPSAVAAAQPVQVRWRGRTIQIQPGTFKN